MHQREHKPVGFNENGSRASVFQDLQDFFQRPKSGSITESPSACVYGAYKIGKTTVIEAAIRESFRDTKRDFISINMNLNKKNLDKVVSEVSKAVLEYTKEYIDSKNNKDDVDSGKTQTTIIPRNQQLSATQLLQPLQVYLCHASKDKHIVHKLYQQLKEEGLMPQINERGFLSIFKQRKKIPEMIYNNDVLLICISRNSVGRNSHVQAQIKFTLENSTKIHKKDISIIVVRLEECDVPDSLKRFEKFDLFAEQGHEQLLEALNCQAERLGLMPLKSYTSDHSNLTNSKEVNINTGAIIEVIHKLFESHYRKSENPENMIRDTAHALAQLIYHVQDETLYINLREVYNSFAIMLQSFRFFKKDIENKEIDIDQVLSLDTCKRFLEKLTEMVNKIDYKILHIVPPPFLIKDTEEMINWSKKFSLGIETKTVLVWELHHKPESPDPKRHSDFSSYQVIGLKKEEVQELIEQKLEESHKDRIGNFPERLFYCIGSHPFFLEEVCAKINQEINKGTDLLSSLDNSDNSKIEAFIVNACNDSNILEHRKAFIDLHKDPLDKFLGQKDLKQDFFGICYENASGRLELAKFYRDFHRDNQEKELSETIRPLEQVFPHSWQDLYAVIIELTAPGDDCNSLRFLRGKLEGKLRSEHNRLIDDIKKGVYTWLEDNNNIELDSLRGVANQIGIERPGELGQNTLAERIKDTIIPQNKLVLLMEALLKHLQKTDQS